MAEERIVTPEKQLLSLIETGSAKNPGIKTRAVRHKGMSLLSPGAWLGRVSFFKANLKKKIRNNHFQADIKVINNSLFVLVFLLTMYFFGSVYLGVGSITRIPTLEFNAQQELKEEVPLQNLSVLKNELSYYLEKVRERDIFRIGEKKQEQAGPSPKEPTSRIIEEIQRFRLVGISWSKNPDAMIEDTVALRTFFVKRGQMLGNVKVEGIFKDKVILSFEDEETELR
ncbi:MAG: hypothetical protein A2Z72_01315 [Omnitrophica bacterium RBG_13_46_9]|nr:MAG: hypothetical protein A2Z72_01315 [Omnitrophica bacterium RBG_13_46_9]